jgi:hypothetical protein
MRRANRQSNAVLLWAPGKGKGLAVGVPPLPYPLRRGQPRACGRKPGCPGPREAKHNSYLGERLFYELRQIEARRRAGRSVPRPALGIELRHTPASLPNEVLSLQKATEGGTTVNTSTVNDTALAIVRLAQGSLMAGHGAQKLFGSFGGTVWRAPAGLWRCWACARDAPGRLWQASPSSGAGPAHGRGTA